MKHSHLKMKQSLTFVLALSTVTLLLGLGAAQEPGKRTRSPSLLSTEGRDGRSNLATQSISTGQGGPEDPNWRVNEQAAYTTPPYPGWITTLLPAQWIQPASSPTPSASIPAGIYTYTYQFSIPRSMLLQGVFAADNSAKLYFNDHLITSCMGPRCFRSPEAPVPFNINSIPLQSMNTLKIVVTNDNDPSPSGLIVHAYLIDMGTKPIVDFDGDGRTDTGVVTPSTWNWSILRSSTGLYNIQFGSPGDVPVLGDFDGDIRTDTTVFRPSGAFWFRLNSSNGTFDATQFGLSGDIPVPGYYDADNKSDIGVFRPSSGTFFLLYSSDGSFHSQQFGANGDVPLKGDYDRDSKTDFAVFRPSTSTFYVLHSSNGAITGQQFGTAGDIPLSADFDGDGKTDIAVYRPSAGHWYYLQSTNNAFKGVAWGTNGDLPVVGEYDGDGKWDIAVFRPSTGAFYILQSASGTLRAEQFGMSGDIPLAAPYIP